MASAPQSRTVSVCIPTCNRSALLREAVLSCLQQTRPPDEILVGDDSEDDATEAMVRDLQKISHVPIRYHRNVPPLGQGSNINSLYDAASTSHLMLLHDDDLLVPNAVEHLLGCWDQNPHLTAAYGMQEVISHDGVVDSKTTESLNRFFMRLPERSGPQYPAWQAGLFQQFPNDGFMVKSEAARAVRWRPREMVGDGGEYDFGLRLSLAYEGFYFLGEYTAQYRLTSGVSISQSRTHDFTLQSYRILRQARLPNDAEQLRATKLSLLAPGAMMEAIRLGHRHEALEIYMSEYHGWRRRLSPGGVKRLLRCLAMSW